MKNTPIQKSNESAPIKRDYTTGTFPARVNSVQASVLVQLLESNTLSGMAGVRNFSSTRLAAFIHALSKNYGWQFEKAKIATGTKDGRVPTITAYWLSHNCLEYSFENGARAWIDSVRIAENKRSEKAPEAQKIAAKINAIRYRIDPRQAKLWGDL